MGKKTLKPTKKTSKYKFGLPDNFSVKLRMTSSIAQSVTANSSKYLIVRTNRPTNPVSFNLDFTPSYWDFWKGAYKYYHVNGCRVRMYIRPASTSPTIFQVSTLPIRLGDSITTSEGISFADQVVAQPMGQTKTLNIGYGSTDTLKIDRMTSVWKTLGRKYDPSLDNNPTDTEGVTEETDLGIWIENIGATANGAIYIKFVIDYFITFNKFRYRPVTLIPGDADTGDENQSRNV